ncbi:hypothetical protein BAG01nite_10290 [Brevibacillus agri]|uniref:Secreted protein n=1 Tax=Brevibacillus agri TaxID=51101 RepID=A0ABQ0SLZ6_9BACL|nr:hypothetical protein BAG01nite_10290 [Brevibacillus agri]
MAETLAQAAAGALAAAAVSVASASGVPAVAALAAEGAPVSEASAKTASPGLVGCLAESEQAGMADTGSQAVSAAEAA